MLVLLRVTVFSGPKIFLQFHIRMDLDIQKQLILESCKSQGPIGSCFYFPILTYRNLLFSILQDTGASYLTLKSFNLAQNSSF